jgi:hypothetical protein
MPGLYVGNYRDSKDLAQLQTHKITHILAIHDSPKHLHPDKHYLVSYKLDFSHHHSFLNANLIRWAISFCYIGTTPISLELTQSPQVLSPIWFSTLERFNFLLEISLINNLSQIISIKIVGFKHVQWKSNIYSIFHNKFYSTILDTFWEWFKFENLIFSWWVFHWFFFCFFFETLRIIEF